MYTKEELAGALIDYYETYGETPTGRDLLKSGYPTISTFQSYFGSFNAALEYAELPTRKYTRLNDKPNICELCGVTETTMWLDKDGLKVCFNCYQSDRHHIHGVLNPNCTVGIAVITEHITHVIIGDCIKCNTVNNFNSKYDLISESFGNINVKSSILRSANNWTFGIRESSYEPDYYIFIGFAKNRTEISHVWYIPSKSNIIRSYGVTITNTIKGLAEANEYEVSASVYNKVYQNLDIYTLSEFENYNKN